MFALPLLLVRSPSAVVAAAAIADGDGEVALDKLFLRLAMAAADRAPIPSLGVREDGCVGVVAKAALLLETVEGIDLCIVIFDTTEN